MKILFTHTYFLAEDEMEQKIMMLYPPLGMLYVSSYLEKNGLPNKIFDSTFETEQNLQNYLLIEQPEIICFYANMMTRPNLIRIINFIKTSEQIYKSIIILGGPDVRFNSDNYLKHGADYLVIGEGEETTFELIGALSKNTGIEAIKGIAYKGMNSEILTNPDRPLLDIEKIPFPAREKVQIEKYLTAWEKRHKYTSINISTMRGCPFGCKWCSKAVYGKTNRRRTPKSVVDEIELILKHYKIDNFWFVDDVFTLNKQWLFDFAKELNDRDKQIRYECITRADQLTCKEINLLKQTGCFRVWIGAESGSQKVLDLMNRKAKIKEVQDTLFAVKKAGMQVGTFIMLGYPGENKKDISATVKHLKITKPDFFTITLTYPIKGTELYNEAELNKESLKNWENSTDRQYDFSRTYKKQFYKYAVQYVQSETGWTQALGKLKIIMACKLKLHSLYAKLKMMQISNF
jgi:anaerobic magnesium-protoporphyrin IX monomethyl ester cyclase